MTRLPISPDVLHAELVSARDILDKWVKTINEGLPALDVPGTEETLEGMLKELCGELVLVSGKCESISEILSGELGG
jgi:hypothetical protein